MEGYGCGWTVVLGQMAATKAEWTQEVAGEVWEDWGGAEPWARLVQGYSYVTFALVQKTQKMTQGWQIKRHN